MAKLVEMIHMEDLLWQVCKVIGYGGFPFRELAERVKPLVTKHGARKVAEALSEIAVHTG